MDLSKPPENPQSQPNRSAEINSRVEENPYQAPTTNAEQAVLRLQKTAPTERRRISQLAQDQRRALSWTWGMILLGLLLMIVAWLTDGETTTRTLVGSGGLMLWLLSLYPAYLSARMSAGLLGPEMLPPLVLPLLIPGLGPVVMIALHVMVARELRRFGFPVGLLGADLASVRHWTVHSPSPGDPD